MRKSSLAAIAISGLLLSITGGVAYATGPVLGREVVTAEFSIPQSSDYYGRFGGHVSCPDNKVPVGGGVSIRTGDATLLTTETVQFSNPAPNGWDSQILYKSGNITQSDVLIVYVVCVLDI